MSALTAIMLVFQTAANEYESNANKSLFWTDSQGALLRRDLKTGNTEVFLSDCSRPYGVVISTDGKRLYFSDTGDLTVTEVNLETRAKRVLCRGIVAFGLALGHQDELFVATGEAAVLRVHLVTGTIMGRVPCTLRAPVAVDVLPDGRLAIADLAGSVVLVGRDGAQQELPGNWVNPVSILAASETTLFVGDSGSHTISKIDLKDGTRELLEIPGVVTPVGLALLDRNTLIISDPDANEFAGAIFAFDLRTSTCATLFVGEGSRVNPRCIVSGGVTPGGNVRSVVEKRLVERFITRLASKFQVESFDAQPMRL